MASNGGRTGPHWRRLEQQVRALAEPCHLCGQPIDYRLPRTTPLGWTVDHIVPISKGGAIYDLANARAAHKGCNSSRCDLDVSEWRTIQQRRSAANRPATSALDLSGFA